MRTGLIVLGIVLLVVGGLLYYLPRQGTDATTTAAVEGGVSTTGVSGWLTGIVLLVGFVLLILGLVIPDKIEEIERVDTTPQHTQKSETKGKRPTTHAHH